MPSASDEMPPLPRRLKIALLPAVAKTPDLVQDALRTDEYLQQEAVAAMQADKNLSVVLPQEVRRAFPEIQNSGDYEFLDHYRMRTVLGVDLILITVVFRPYDSIERTTHKLSAYSGRSLDARLAPGVRGPTVFQFREHRAGEFARFLVASHPAEKPAPGACMACEGECSRCNGKKCILNFGVESDLDEVSEEFTDAWDSAARSSFSPGFTYSGPAESGTMISKPEHALPYFLHLPPNFQKTGWGYPLLIYLHGTRAHNETLSTRLISESPLAAIYTMNNGEHSMDPSRLNALNKYLKSSFVLMPQVSLSRLENDVTELKLLAALNKLVTEVLEEYPVDPSRVYITGISQGGFRTWAYSELLSNRVAAIAPICGGDAFTYKCCTKTTAVWAHHSYDDKAVGIRQIHPTELMLPGGFYPGDINIMEDYPFIGRKKIFLKDQFSRPHPGEVYLDFMSGGAADTDYTATLFPVRSGWKRGVIPPDGTIGFTMYNRSGHCPWPYANPGFWDWIYAQRRKSP